MEARAKAAKAAQRRRMTIGEWVDSALTAAANEELGSGRGQPQPAPSPEPAMPAPETGSEDIIQLKTMASAAPESQSQQTHALVDSNDLERRDTQVIEEIGE